MYHQRTHRFTNAIPFQHKHEDSAKIVRRQSHQQNSWDPWKEDDAFVHEAEELSIFLCDDDEYDDDEEEEKEKEASTADATKNPIDVRGDNETDTEITNTNALGTAAPEPNNTMDMADSSLETSLSNLQLAPASEIIYFYLKDKAACGKSPTKQDRYLDFRYPTFKRNYLS